MILIGYRQTKEIRGMCVFVRFVMCVCVCVCMGFVMCVYVFVCVL